jgi:hypothetical protein
VSARGEEGKGREEDRRPGHEKPWRPVRDEVECETEGSNFWQPQELRRPQGWVTEDGDRSRRHVRASGAWELQLGAVERGSCKSAAQNDVKDD